MVSDAKGCAAALASYRAERKAFVEQVDFLTKSATVRRSVGCEYVIVSLTSSCVVSEPLLQASRPVVLSNT